MLIADDVKSFVCIHCPLGCQVEVSCDSSGKIEDVSGFSCIRGKEYALGELKDPRRVVTTLTNVQGSLEPLSVKTAGSVPKNLIDDVLREIHALQLSTPITRGDILINDVCGTGVSVVATKTIQNLND